MEVKLSDILTPRRLSSQEVKEVLKKEQVHIYLSGPISFAEDLQDYRRQLKEGLLKISQKFVIHDPWEREQVESKDCDGDPELEELRHKAEKVIIRDLEDICNCDLVLAYMFRIGAGTSMEIFWANRILRKPVILIYQPAEEVRGPVPLWLVGHSNLILYSKRSLYSWLRKTLEEISNERGN